MNKDTMLKSFEKQIKGALDNNKPLNILIELNIKRFYDENKSIYNLSIFEQYFKKANLIENLAIRKNLVFKRRLILIPVIIALLIETFLLNNKDLQNYIIFIAALTLIIGVATLIFFGNLFNKLNNKRYNDWYNT